MLRSYRCCGGRPLLDVALLYFKEDGLGEIEKVVNEPYSLQGVVHAIQSCSAGDRTETFALSMDGFWQQKRPHILGHEPQRMDGKMWGSKSDDC